MEKKEINVVKIMEEIRRGGGSFFDDETDISIIIQNIEKETQKNNLICDVPDIATALKEFEIKSVSARIDYAKPKCAMVYYRPIENNIIIKFVKRVMRKLMAFCIIPIATVQTEYNMTLLSIVETQHMQIKDLQDKICELEEKAKKGECE